MDNAAIWIVVALAAIGGAIYALSRRKAVPRKDTLELFREAETLARQIVDECVGRALAMRVVDRATTPLLHSPVYDCGSDLFDPPCKERGFDDFPEGRDWLAAKDLPEVFNQYAEQDARRRVDVIRGGGDAVVAGDGFLDVLHGTERGGYVRRLVRVDQDRWRLCRWKSGMVPSARDLDPPFDVTVIARDPGLWLLREQRLRDLWRNSSAWHDAATLCSHGHGGG